MKICHSITETTFHRLDFPNISHERVQWVYCFGSCQAESRRGLHVMLDIVIYGIRLSFRDLLNNLHLPWDPSPNTHPSTRGSLSISFIHRDAHKPKAIVRQLDRDWIYQNDSSIEHYMLACKLYMKLGDWNNKLVQQPLQCWSPLRESGWFNPFNLISWCSSIWALRWEFSWLSLLDLLARRLNFMSYRQRTRISWIGLQMKRSSYLAAF